VPKPAFLGLTLPAGTEESIFSFQSPGLRISSPRIRLLEADPDLGRFLSEGDLAEACRVLVPTIDVDRDGAPLQDRLGEHHAFAALVLDGMVLQHVQIGDQVAMRLLGPGDIVSLDADASSVLVATTSTQANPGTQLALLGVELLVATRRWPELVRGLHLRSVQQVERLAAQLAVCQLPRVDQRLLALMWLLAESWGRVTPAGTILPLKLTHDALGSLIGARRPTVTLALRHLSDRGAIGRQDQGWLLLEAPPGPTRPAERFRGPSLIAHQPNRWADRHDPLAVPN
jgi:CRP/FNR family transcriptional regulator, cyclic AMP receptor protein